MRPEPFRPLRFDPILYPLWRRQQHSLVKPFAEAVFRRMFPTYADQHQPGEPAHLARYLVDEGIVRGDVNEWTERISASTPSIEVVAQDGMPPQHDGSPVCLPAQWAPAEAVLLRFGTFYPDVWPMHAQMIEAISTVARCDVLVDHPLWAYAICAYLHERNRARREQVRFLVLPTNDVWIRDYGPIVGYDRAGQRVALNATYAVLPQYPQGDDDGMPARWAAHRSIPVQPLELFTEGGNVWSDGQGTLIMSEQIFYSNRYHDRERLLAYLHARLDFDRLIITPRLTLEETGHVDLLVKLAGPQTVLVSAATSFSTSEALRKTRRLLARTTNARGEPYHILELPTPPLYLNWFTYTIRRAYTNSLTLNGTVLVPVFGLPEDEVALRQYEIAMPGVTVIPIESAIGINGGGAVHCMTKEVPVAQPHSG